MSSEADVRISVPGALRHAPLAPPDLTQSPRLTIEQWESGVTNDGAALTWACVRGDTSSWSQDATDLVQGKLAELASSTAARMRGEPTPMHVTATAGRERTLASDDANAMAQARTFVSFTSGEAHGCFVTCTPQSAGAEPSKPCDDSVNGATLTGELREPPPPGIALDSLAFVVHHPRSALAMLATSLVLAALLAIVTRRRQ
jgi:hypothetical protein